MRRWLWEESRCQEQRDGREDEVSGIRCRDMKFGLTKKNVWASLLVLLVAIIGGDTLGAGTVPSQAARAYLFNIYTWHLENFPARWTHTARQAFPGASTEGESLEDVRKYFELAANATSIQRKLDASNDQRHRAALQNELTAVTGQRDSLRYAAERGVEDLISKKMIDAGLTRRVGFQDVLWPPVYFRISEMPSILVVSPRDRILIQETHLLTPDMTPADVEELETTVDEHGLSSLVEDIGGVATYPSLIPGSIQLDYLLEVTSHEWTHHYLYFRPLGRNYFASGDMRVINETVADLVGREVGKELYQENFQPGKVSQAASLPPAPTRQPAFDFTTAMRETRVMAEGLLAEGKVAEAEAYMEDRRQFINSHGYSIRKLNQAYFAFHGNYGERPGSVSPIGGYVRAIRSASPTLEAFVDRVSAYDSYEDLLQDYQSLNP